MRFALVGLLGLAMLNLKSCNLSQMTSPEAVASTYQEGLRDYFPRAVAQAIPDQHMLLGVTCLYGEGPELIRKIRENFVNDPALKKIHWVNAADALLRTGTYRYIAVGTETTVLAMDIDSQQISQLQPWPNYKILYAAACPLPNVSAQNTVAAGGPTVWIGNFSGVVDCKNGHHQSITRADTLGMAYANREGLDRHLGDEVRFETERWSESWAKHDCTISNVTLLKVTEFHLPQSPAVY